MILTVTLNAAVDKTYRVDGFALDRVHRPSEWRIVAGGKGINVARVYSSLGGTPVTTGFMGGYNGRFIAASLAEEGIRAEFVRTREESRVCIAVVDRVNTTQTEVNEVGPTVSAAEVRALKRRVRALLRSRPWEYLVLSGSLPPGVPDSIYADLTADARAAGVRSVVDASGEALALGIEARPWMVKPNIHELAYIRDCGGAGSGCAADAARELVRAGIEVACVTMGADGAVCVTNDGVWNARPPHIRFVSAVGSGDSMLGAFLWALGSGCPVSEALRLGVGAGAANAAVYGAGLCSPESIRELAAAATVDAADKQGVVSGRRALA